MTDDAKELVISNTLEKAKEWLLKNRLLLVLVLSAIVLLVIVLYRFQSRTKGRVFLAEKEYAHYLATKEESSLRKLMTITSKDKNLHNTFDIPIALALLEKKNKEEAAFYLKRALKPLEETSPYHALYAQSTLSILKSDWEKALQDSLELKKQIQDYAAGEDFSSLYFTNLLRIALLEKKLNHPLAELQAWQELETSLEISLQKEPSSFKKEWVDNLKQKGIAIEDFIKDRRNSLSASN